MTLLIGIHVQCCHLNSMALTERLLWYRGIRRGMCNLSWGSCYYRTLTDHSLSHTGAHTHTHAYTQTCVRHSIPLLLKGCFCSPTGSCFIHGFRWKYFQMKISEYDNVSHNLSMKTSLKHRLMNNECWMSIISFRLNAQDIISAQIKPLFYYFIFLASH